MYLRELRIKNNYSQQEMANILNISQSFYCQLENNQRTLSYLMAIKISNIFNLKPDDIFYDVQVLYNNLLFYFLPNDLFHNL